LLGLRFRIGRARSIRDHLVKLKQHQPPCAADQAMTPIFPKRLAAKLAWWPLVVVPIALSLLLFGCGESQDPQERGMQLLQFAESGNASALDALLGRNGDANFRDSCDWTPLMKAAVNGHLDAARRLLDAGAKVDAADKGGYTALLLAASNNHAAVVELLLDRGAMIDAQEATQGYTPLIWAAHRGHTQTVSALLRRGADRTLPDVQGLDAARHAGDQGHAELETMLSADASGQATAARPGSGAQG
jgi:ankyrin repeat protein